MLRGFLTADGADGADEIGEVVVPFCAIRISLPGDKLSAATGPALLGRLGSELRVPPRPDLRGTSFRERILPRVVRVAKLALRIPIRRLVLDGMEDAPGLDPLRAVSRGIVKAELTGAAGTNIETAHQIGSLDAFRVKHEAADGTVFDERRHDSQFMNP